MSRLATRAIACAKNASSCLLEACSAHLSTSHATAWRRAQVMLEKPLQFSLTNRSFARVLATVLGAFGYYVLEHPTIEASPDPTQTVRRGDVHPSLGAATPLSARRTLILAPAGA